MLLRKRGSIFFVRHTCSFTIGCKSRADVDHRELLAEGKGVVARQGLKEAEGKSE